MDPQTATDATIKLIERLTAVQTFVMSVAAVLIALVLRGFRTGQWAQRQLDAQDGLVRRVDEAHRRMDQAGEEMSKLGTDIQGLPDRMRSIFLSTERFEEINKRNHEENERLQREIELLWSNVRRLDKGPRTRS